MKATITIDMDNAAFEDEQGVPELSFLLRSLVTALEDSIANDRPIERMVALRDSNGNKVGKFEVTED